MLQEDNTNKLLVLGSREIATPAAAQALQAAQAVYDAHKGLAGAPFDAARLVKGGCLPGTYRATGDVQLDGLVVLDGRGDVNAAFVFIVEGDLTTASPDPAFGTGLLLQNGAQAGNVFWIVRGKVELGHATNFQGTILSEKDIRLKNGTMLTGRAISLQGGVELSNNQVFLPYRSLADLRITKIVEDKEYAPGDEISYTITVYNYGPGTARNVMVQEQMLSGLAFVRAESATVGTYDAATQQWNISALQANTTAVLKLTFKITAPGQVANKVVVSSDSPDPNLNNNDCVETITVGCAAPKLALKGADALCPDATNETYTLTGVPFGAKYTFTLSGGLTEESSTGNSITVKIGTTAGKISAEVKDLCGKMYVVEKEVGLMGKPAKPLIEGNEKVCAQAAGLVYTARDMGEAVTYSWTATGDISIVRGGKERGVVVDVGPQGGTLTVTATNKCFSSEPATIAVGTYQAPASPAAITGDDRYCAGTENVFFTIAGVQGATAYSWTVPADWEIVSGQGTTAIKVRIGKTSGRVQVSAQNACGSSAAASLTVYVTNPPAAPQAIEGSAGACPGTVLTYSIAEVEGATGYTWTVPASWTLLSGQGTHSITVNAGAGGGSVTVSATNACGISKARTLAVNPTSPQAAGPVQDQSNVCDGLMYAVAPVPGATAYIWTVPEGFTITAGQGTTTIKVKAAHTQAIGQVSVVALNGTCPGPAASYTINQALAEGELSFPKAFSPNNDGRNDTWVVTNLAKYPGNEVVIFNRWGTEVFRKRNYQNDWNGNRLEQGTYFYKVRVQLCGGTIEEFTGYVSLFR